MHDELPRSAGLNGSTERSTNAGNAGQATIEADQLRVRAGGSALPFLDVGEDAVAQVLRKRVSPTLNDATDRYRLARPVLDLD